MTGVNEDICSLDDQLLSSSSSSPEPLSQSCPESLLRENCLPLDVSTGDCLDDDLKELSWLQKRHLLRELQPSVGIVEPIDSSGLESDSECDELDGHSLSPTGHNVPSDGCYSPSSILHCSPSIVSYNPTENPQAKPPYSFSCLIFMAIEEAAEKRLPVKEIYKWIMDKFPYFRNAPTGWKNSVRHNLSLNKCFKKVDKEKGQAIGKGSLWCIDTDYRPNLLQALKRTPYHPFHQLQMLSQPHVSQSTILTRYMESLPPFLRHLNTPSPQLFPNLSKKFGLHDSSSASSNNGAESVSDSEVNAASTLMMFKKAKDYTDSKRRLKRAASPEDVARSRKRMRSWMRTSTPRRKQLLKVKMKSPVSRTVTDDTAKSADHTYSAENHSSSDADESDMDECDSASKRALPVRKSKRKSAMPRKIKRARPKKSKDDEQLKVAEGADALLNLAGVKTSSLVPMVALSPSSNNNNSEDVVNQNMLASKA